jgi:hypothetical protein
MDQRAIRAAYAARLKAIDPDADPGAFISLRVAYDQARRGEQAREEPAPLPVSQDDFHARLAELTELFLVVAGNIHPWLTPEAKAQLRESWRGIAEDPRMADISFYGAAELEVARLIASWGPIAVGLVIPATEFFGWAKREIDVSTDDAIVEVVRRYRLVRFLQVVRKPVNAHHAAWVELTTKAYPGSSRGRCDPVLVHELLVIIREIWPELETELDPLRVELWRENTADPRYVEKQLAAQAKWRRLRVIAFVLFWAVAFLRLCWVIAEQFR